MKRLDHADARALMREVKLRRIQLGLTREAIGGQIGLSRQGVRQMEEGITVPSLGAFCRLVEALDMQVGLCRPK